MMKIVFVYYDTATNTLYTYCKKRLIYDDTYVAICLHYGFKSTLDLTNLVLPVGPKCYPCVEGR